jgi:glutamyl-tRNA synthetase
MPLLRNKDKSKISKRKNPTSLAWYRDQGFLPEALVNFLGLMGYSMPDGREVFTLAEMEATFDRARVSTTTPVFDLEKLQWLNGEKIRALSEDEVAARVLGHLGHVADAVPADERGDDQRAVLSWIDAHGGFTSPEVLARVRRTVPLVRERIKTLKDYAVVAKSFFAADVRGYEGPALVPKGRTPSEVHDLLGAAGGRLEPLPAWEAAAIEGALRALGEASGWKARDLFQPIRVAVTGSPVSPPLFESMEILGRTTCLARIHDARAALGG